MTSRTAPESPVAEVGNGRHDPMKRRQATRGGRQKGCYVYIAAEQLSRAGYDPSGPAPFYRVWPSSHGGLLENGTTTKARVARVRWQLAPRKPWKVANIIVEEERPSLVVQAVSIYLKEQEQA